ncbi:MAG: guanylate kinase [Candidatus Bipolaricaulota bacterium]|nr:guanylate kinase [Candidatus Bipolaricaulota bacterium]MDW8031207.1 guanylate kinase [Candidatus Bipolaricaulota bacterium]
MAQIFFVICGPSGAGKTTLLTRVRKRFPDLVYVPSYTSRPPRSPQELTSGRYRFISREEFERRIRRNEFLEYAIYAEHYYGTPRSEVYTLLAAGHDVIKEAEVQGVRQLRRRRLPGRLVAIFILPPSLEELEHRLDRRGTESVVARRRRLAAVLDELSALDLFDYMVINRRVTESVTRLCAIIRAERSL